MSISGINSNVNVNSKIELQQNQKSKLILPIIGTLAGATVAGVKVIKPICKRVNLGVRIASENMEKRQEYIQGYKAQMAKTPVLKEWAERRIKETEQHISSYKTEIANLKKSLKPMKVLKAVAKAPMTYIWVLQGLSVGLAINHFLNKKVEKNNSLNSQV